ncbi:MAG: xanthine dehydrogenase molybdopterin binding subunit, partial [Pseudomonadota bacterium]
MNKHVRNVERAIVGKGIAHDSAKKHVRGDAIYIDDMPEVPGTLHAALVLSPVAHGRLRGIDVSKALALDGVVGFASAADIKGHNDIAPILPGEELFATEMVEYIGQPVGVICATSNKL